MTIRFNANPEIRREKKYRKPIWVYGNQSIHSSNLKFHTKKKKKKSLIFDEDEMEIYEPLILDRDKYLVFGIGSFSLYNPTH